MSHANIVAVYEVGEYQGCPYLMLEYVEGGSLAERLAGTPLPPRPAAETVLVLARAVQHAHERGVLHCDLKPGNVLLTADGTPKIADFGLARRLDVNTGQTQTGTIAGTPSYMAPEQAEGRVHELGPTTDVYALGVVLYELLTGRPPFKAASVLETLEQVRSHDPVRPTALQPGLPRDLEAVCLRCLEKPPAQRYASAADLADDLQRFLQGERVSARGPSLHERVGRVLGYCGLPTPIRSGGRTQVALAPLPLVVQLVLWLLFGGWPAYPVIVLAVGVLVAAILAPVVLLAIREPMRRAGREYRRFQWALMSVRWAGWLMVPLLVALLRPGRDLAEFYLVFPVLIFLDGNLNLTIGSRVGLGYVLAGVHYAAAVLAALAPGWSPLLLGVLMSGQLLVEWLYLRRLEK